MGSQLEYFFKADSPFSQWYPSCFQVPLSNGQVHIFSTAEQYMMYKKAILFNDTETANQVLQTADPQQCKKLGKMVKNLDPKQWDLEKENIVYEGNRFKFQQNPELQTILLSTRGKILVEASPYDKIWGIGLASDDERAKKIRTWNGANLLGRILTNLRNNIDISSAGRQMVEDSAFRLDQFEGCLHGVLIGDTLGFPFERKFDLDDFKIQQYFDNMGSSRQALPYTDDTSMTISTANSLLEYRGFNVHNMARRYVKRFYLEQQKYYGSKVKELFQNMKSTNFGDIYGLAASQFNGSGSLGNGAAMRISPATLFTFYQNDLNVLTNLVVDISRITHSHSAGICGALFQTLAIRQALIIGEEVYCGKFTTRTQNVPKGIVHNLREDLDRVLELYVKEEIRVGMQEYLQKLCKIQSWLDILYSGGQISKSDIVKNLGNDVTALGSVPTALFCFLAGFHPIQHVNATNKFRRTIQLAVSLGGDADTIASMACALSGAFYGVSHIPRELIARCKDEHLLKVIARRMFQFRDNPSVNN